VIVGSGLIAKSLGPIDHSNSILFASGVSNSSEIRKQEFEREKLLLTDWLSNQDDAKFVYISSCSVYDMSLQTTQYVRHKLAMEEYALSQSNSYVIRLPNIVGASGNGKNLVNSLANSIKYGQPVLLQESARRYLLGIDEMTSLIQVLLPRLSDDQRIFDLVPPSSTGIMEIVALLETVLGTRAKIEIVSGGSSYIVDYQTTKNLAALAGFDFPEDYSARTIKKWHSNDI
jgi:nucleoside-diphosphate-sugar epimerase